MLLSREKAKGAMEERGAAQSRFTAASRRALVMILATRLGGKPNDSVLKEIMACSDSA
jgi:hypothetical protein